MPWTISESHGIFRDSWGYTSNINSVAEISCGFVVWQLWELGYYGGGISISLGLPGYTPTSNRSTNIGNLQQHHSMFVKHIRNWIKHLRNSNKNTRKLSRKRHWTSTHKTRHPKHILLGESSNDSEDMLWLDHVPALRDGWGAGRKLTIWILLVNPLAQWMFQHGCFVNSENYIYYIELWTALILQMAVEDSWSVVHCGSLFKCNKKMTGQWANSTNPNSSSSNHTIYIYIFILYIYT